MDQRAPRSYPETIEVWRTSCPCLAVWEDALADGLVRVERGQVLPSAKGDELLLEHGADGAAGRG